MNRLLPISQRMGGIDLKKQKKWRKSLNCRTISLVLAMGILAAACAGCGSKEQPQHVPDLVEPVGVDVDTAVVTKMELSSMCSYQGEVVPDMKGMYFLNSGQVASVEVNIGDKVKKGQLLATLKGADTTVKDLQKDLLDMRQENEELNASAKNTIKQMKEEYRQLLKKRNKAQTKKEKAAFDKQKIAQEESIKTEELKLKHQKELQASIISELNEDLAKAKKKTKWDKLYSDISGEVINKTISAGDFVSGGGVVFTLANMEKTRIRTEYIGSSVLKKASSYHAMINGKRYEVTAEKQEISQYDIEMGNFPASTYFDYKSGVHAQVGDSVSIDLYNNETDDALVVPSNAVYKTKGSYYVYRMEGGAKKRVNVTTGTVTDAYTQILSGVKEGDVVYVQD